MRATNGKLTDFLSTANRQYRIPAFQRPYAWEKENVKKLCQDVVSVSRDQERPCHFIGSVIYLPQSQFSTQINECFVIDGQQRLTTISLLLLALADYSRSFYSYSDYQKASTRYEQISELYLINKFVDGASKYKLRLGDADFSAYQKLFEWQQYKEKKGRKEAGEKPIVSSDVEKNLVWKHFHWICGWLKDEKLEPNEVMKGICKLLLIDIPLDKNDNAQLVFETVNSTGKPLNEAQKIKNYILMNVLPEEQEKLYKNVWQPMEQALTEKELDDLIRYYLTVQMEEKVPKEYYETFKNFLSNKSNKGSVISEINKYYEHYLRWKKAETTSKDSVDQLIANIKVSKQDITTPVILKILDNLQSGRCTIDQTKKILAMIESYWMRRAICDLPSNTAGTVTITMLKNLGNNNEVDNMIEMFVQLTEAQKMPEDDEIKSKLYEVSIYRKPFAKILLDRIEAHENKEYFHFGNYTIEHIMPQHIQSHEELYARTDLTDSMKEKLDWATDLGENWQQIYKKYLDTIGNLTLTGFNSEYQNYRFQYKKEMKNGYRESPIRLTSQMVANKEKWGEAEIRERSDEMAKIICDIWRYPKKETETGKET